MRGGLGIGSWTQHYSLLGKQLLEFWKANDAKQMMQSKSCLTKGFVVRSLSTTSLGLSLTLLDNTLEQNIKINLEQKNNIIK